MSDTPHTETVGEIVRGEGRDSSANRSGSPADASSADETEADRG